VQSIVTSQDLTDPEKTNSMGKQLVKQIGRSCQGTGCDTDSPDSGDSGVGAKKKGQSNKEAAGCPVYLLTSVKSTNAARS